jgi:myo-inositol-1(or 4)-monophosphatase
MNTPTLADLENLAHQAGEILRLGFDQGTRIYHKGDIDLVTDVDHRSEAFLLDEIQRRFPGSAIVAEESGALPGQDCCKWYIDPLDGTVNFAHGVPIFSVSIAYAEDGCVRLGAVYDPMQDECFTADLGRGAWLNGKPIHVSTTLALDQSLLVTGFPYDVRTNPQNNLDLYSRFTLLSQGVRRLGSAALDLSYVAAGRFEGFWELRLGPWDVAAGGLIAQEAGARVTSAMGEPDYLAPPCSILAANPQIHPQMLKVIGGDKE